MSGPALPHTDRIVFALWRRGELHAAQEVASLALVRMDARRLEVGQQLERIGLGLPLAPLDDVPLDLPLVAGLVERYRYHEARALLVALGLELDLMGRKLALVLDEALAPFPPDADPSFGAALQLVKAGQAPSCLRALDEVVRESVEPPTWLVARQRALSDLVHGGWSDAPVDVPVEAMTRDTVLARLRARDLAGALEAARAAGARELAAVLRRLLDGTERVLVAEPHRDLDDPETMPMEGHRLCELQVRMGVLAEADRGYRAILRREPADDRARARLADVITLRRAMGEEPEAMPQRDASVSWLRKNAPRARDGGSWSAGSDPAAHQRFEESSLDESTGVLEAAQEAELLLKLGKTAQALDVYRILAIRHPKQDAYRRRILEIEAMIAQRMEPLAVEATLKHDLTALSAQAVPTNPRIRLPGTDEFPSFADEEEEGPATLIDRIARPSEPEE